MPSQTDIFNHNLISQSVLADLTQFNTYVGKPLQQEISNNTQFDNNIINDLNNFNTYVGKPSSQEISNNTQFDTNIITNLTQFNTYVGKPLQQEISNNADFDKKIINNLIKFKTYFKRITQQEISNNTQFDDKIIKELTQFNTYVKKIIQQEKDNNAQFDDKIIKDLTDFKEYTGRIIQQEKDNNAQFDRKIIKDLTDFKEYKTKEGAEYNLLPIQSGPDTPQSASLLNVNYGSSLITSGQSLAGSLVQSFIPYSGQVAQAITSVTLTGVNPHPYPYVPFSQLTGLNFGSGFPRGSIKFSDFRSRRYIGRAGNILFQPLDGAFAAATNPIIPKTDESNARPTLALLYAAAAASPAGAYSVFNRELDKDFGVGWGRQGEVGAIRNDFTLQSEVATKWQAANPANPAEKSGWIQKKASKFIPFRGDKVTVIDFGKRDFKNIYQWKPSTELNLGKIGVTDGEGKPLKIPKEHLTQDFIKFYFTGPEILPNGTGADDVIVFRATLDSLTDSFNPQWTPDTIIGRADSNHHYSSYDRDLQFNFTVYATDADELKPIWRKLNALAGYTAPEYDSETIAMIGPWMRLTIGDLFVQQPGFISSLSYTLVDSDTTWETNLLQQPDVMQVPKKVNVSVGFTLVTNELPQKGGRFYSLAKRYAAKKTDETEPVTPGALTGDDNWLSDFKGNAPPPPTPPPPPANTTDTSTADEYLAKWRKFRERVQDIRLRPRPL